jgi:hypothetical protein
LPQSVFCVLERVAEVMARGDSITLVPVAGEVPTQRATNLLNLSRQSLVRLLDEGRIPVFAKPASIVGYASRTCSPSRRHATRIGALVFDSFLG